MGEYPKVGTPANVGTPPRDRTAYEYLICCGRYASCVHVGRLSCFHWIQEIYNWSVTYLFKSSKAICSWLINLSICPGWGGGEEGGCLSCLEEGREGRRVPLSCPGGGRGGEYTCSGLVCHPPSFSLWTDTHLRKHHLPVILRARAVLKVCAMQYVLAILN